jgi:hypothetical protein
MEPKIVNDRDFFPMRVIDGDGNADEIEIQPTQPYDELVNLLNFVDTSGLDYSTPVELQRQLPMLCTAFMAPMLAQRLTPELLMQTEAPERLAIQNRLYLKPIGERIASGLFASRAEVARLRVQLRSLFDIVVRTQLMPALADAYPLDFMIDGEDLFAPAEAYARLLGHVTHRISALGLTPESDALVTRTFFLDFVDQIDVAMDFQKTIMSAKLPKRLATFCQAHTAAVDALSERQRVVLGRAAVALHGVRRVHSISYNLRVALRALRPLTILPPATMAIAVAMSGNPDIAGFADFINRYLRDDAILAVILLPEEQDLIARLRSAVQTVDRPSTPPI